MLLLELQFKGVSLKEILGLLCPCTETAANSANNAA